MIQRKNSTLDIYEYAGAILRLLKALGTKAAVKVSSILNAADMDKFLRALNKVDEICSHAEGKLYREFTARLTRLSLCDERSCLHSKKAYARPGLSQITNFPKKEKRPFINQIIGGENETTREISDREHAA